MSNINLCIVGTNFISDRFVEAAKLVSGVSVYAVYSRKEETGREFAKRHGIEVVYTDYISALSDPLVGAVYIASPTVCHSEQACLAMEYGKHVLCEKMIAADLEGFLKMRDMAKKTGCVLLEAMRPAFDPTYDIVREQMKQIGKIRRASLSFCQYSSRYDKFKEGIVENAFDPKMKNSALSDIGIYPLHLAISLFGEPSELVCRSLKLHNGFDGAGEVLMDYSDKIVSVIYSKIADGFSPSVIEGERGSLLIDKISAPRSITLCIRGEKPKILRSSAAENNMVYEIAALRDMISGVSDCTSHLDLVEGVMRTVKRAYADGGILKE